MGGILITGATGNIGGQVVLKLLSSGTPVRALVRDPQAAALPPQVEVVTGDLTVPESLDRCLDGIDTVFLVWVSPADSVAAVLERIARRPRRLVFLSAPLKTPHPLFQQSNASRARAEMIEQLIETSGSDWTYLRPGMYSRNAVGWWGPMMRAGDVVRWPHLEVPTAPIDERDIAAVAACVLCEDGHSRAEYVLTGPQSLTQREQISTIGATIGRSLSIEGISPDEWMNELPSYIPPFVAKYLLDAWAAAAGQPAFVTNTVAELTGTPARTFREWCVDRAGLFEIKNA